MMESPGAVLDAPVIALAGGRLAGLAFGSEDYCGALGIASSAASLDWPAQMLATAARARGLAAFGLPGPVSEIDDVDAFSRLLGKAKAMGFTGCTCIHPKQVAAANRVYSPSPEEIALAEEVVAAFEAAVREGRGAFALHGRMIDAPVADQARATLARVRLAALKLHGVGTSAVVVPEVRRCDLPGLADLPLDASRARELSRGAHCRPDLASDIANAPEFWRSLGFGLPLRRSLSK